MSSVSSHHSSNQGLLHHERLSFVHAVKAHKRFTLRAVTIAAAAIGLVLNFTIIMVAVTARRADGPARISGIAFIPLVLTMVWYHVDLASHKLFSREIPSQVLLLIDSLGFALYVAILVANVIVTSNYNGNYHGGVKALPTLMTYNSMPWLICCSVHFILIQKEVFQYINKLRGNMFRGNGCSHCAHCRQEWSTQTRKPSGGAQYSLLSAQAQYDEDADIERGTVSIEETRQTEGTPLTASAEEDA